ncbi:polysaccharide deacetylase [Caldimonas brevitalea]|uniref:Polysaccharide deacetylase n=1 Tax=Caldimonas brevitalea TaxID=413882 RepID=A0A0G3BM42_9BURK|nr:polysaccharide deacetylase [Caldimonas brevitalea]
MPRATRWPLPTFVKLTLVCHALAVLLLLALPSAWRWSVGLLLLNHAAITAIGLWPRSHWLGENVTRLPAPAVARGEVALTIDDGPDPEVTPAVLDLLDAAGARATFFCIAERAVAHPELLREIVRRGHSVQNHTQRHDHRFSLLGTRGYVREIGAAQASFERLTGTRPTLFRAPAGLRNPFLAPVLHRLGLTLVSWTRRGYDTRERDPERVLARLCHDLRAGDILLLHDGNAARTHAGRPVVLEVLPRLLRRCADAHLRLVTLPQALETPPLPALPARYESLTPS